MAAAALEGGGRARAHDLRAAWPNPSAPTLPRADVAAGATRPVLPAVRARRLGGRGVSRRKRRPSPAFPMYPKDFLGDVNTITMTAEEVGAYFLLLLHGWESGAELPNDLDELAKLARIGRRRFPRMWEQKLSRCFTVSRNKLTLSNPRQCREAAKQRKYSATQAAKARQRWGSGDAAAKPGDSRGSPAGMPPPPPPPPPAPAPPTLKTYPQDGQRVGSEKPPSCGSCIGAGDWAGWNPATGRICTCPLGTWRRTERRAGRLQNGQPNADQRVAMLAEIDRWAEENPGE